MQTASEIPGLVPSKIDTKGSMCSNGQAIEFKWGYNDAIDQIAPKHLEVVIDRKKLVKVLNKCNHISVNTIADAIILSAKQDKDFVTIKCVEGEPNGA